MGNNIIHINGKPYDAETGEPIGGEKGHKSLKPIKKTAAAGKSVKTSARSVDGLSLSGSAKTAAKPSSPVSRIVKKPVAQEAKTTRPPRQSGVAAHIKPQRTQTLRRKSLVRPHRPESILARSAPIAKKDPKPKTRAKSSAKSDETKVTTNEHSPLIYRFNRAVFSPIETGEPVRPPKSSDIEIEPSKVESKKAPKKPPLSAKDALIAQKMAELRTKPKARKADDKSGKGKVIAIIVAAVIVLAVGLYIIYVNIPNVAIKFAAYRAGFNATLPHYIPSGYSFDGPIKYQPGQVTIAYKSNTDNRRYSVMEQPSQWDSEAVYDNYVTKHSNQPPYTFQDSGLTIYVFGSSSAAWVNAGKFYTINGGNSDLSPEQLQNIATSL